MSQTQFDTFRRNMQNEALAPFRAHLRERRVGLACKRVFDIGLSFLAIVLLSPLSILSALSVKLSSKGPVFYRQLRVALNGEPFYVLKFRTMTVGADKSGELTVGSGDARITGVGKVLRATNFDEFPQMFQVFSGKMSIVGVRPEVPRYVAFYTPADYATLLMKPGLTSPVAILYRHENDILAKTDDPERAYIEQILPAKMKINRDYVANFSFLNDLAIIGRTVKCIFEKDEALSK